MDGGSSERSDYGVLVGWGHSAFGGKIDLKLQTVRSMDHLKNDEVDSQHIVMTESQAATLATYLFNLVGHTPPRKPGLLERLLGG
jgi:hypothetical protein